jgi:hypothetical protein
MGGLSLTRVDFQTRVTTATAANVTTAVTTSSPSPVTKDIAVKAVLKDD